MLSRVFLSLSVTGLATACSYGAPSPEEPSTPVPAAPAATESPPLSEYEVPYAIGVTHFAPGDSIEITGVYGNRPDFEQGGTYRVVGAYRLESRDEATLLLSVARRDAGGGVVPTQQTARLDVGRGSGGFELIARMPYEGWPHVSFYATGATEGGSFGDTYFGKDDTLKLPVAQGLEVSGDAADSPGETDGDKAAALADATTWPGATSSTQAPSSPNAPSAPQPPSAAGPSDPSRDPGTSIPGWTLTGRSAHSYRVERDDTVAAEGKASVRMESVGRPPEFGTLMQTVGPDAYRGKRVRFSAAVKTEDVARWAGLWMRIDRTEGRTPFDSMQARPIRGTTDWKRHEVVLDVPSNATDLDFGLLFHGAGKVWMDAARLEVVPPSVPVTAGPLSTLANDFEQLPSAWSMSGDGWQHYRAVLDASVRHGGVSSARLEPASVPRGYGSYVATMDAVPYRGKRVRMRAYVRASSVSGRGDLRLRVQGARASGSDLGGGSCYLSGTFDWRPCDIVFDVPLAAVTVELGLGLGGPGTVWLDDVWMAVVPNAIPLSSGTSPPPENLGFEE